MNEIKSFVLGFGLSILGISFYSQQPSNTQPTKNTNNTNNVRIELFKEANATLVDVSSPNFNIKKQTISCQANTTNLAQLETTNNNLPQVEAIDINGIEDDEIININTDNIIPIDFYNNKEDNILFSKNEEQEKVASLPQETFVESETEEESPWVVATTSKLNTKQKDTNPNISIETPLSIPQNGDENLSYEVAEKIKQSIIFPIPDEILSDENLTPTFINKKENPKPTQTIKKQTPPKVIEKKQVKTSASEKAESNILNNISSWFTTTTKDNTTKKDNSTKKASPVYNSQQPTQAKNTNKPKQNIGDFYEALQTTKSNSAKKNITPTELKLSFNQDRAEISGHTLKWLKAFSEKTINTNYQLQIKLDSNTPLELQKKRLNLLFSIFSNNGVNINNINTTLSNIEPNTFIIRTIKPQQEKQ